MKNYNLRNRFSRRPLYNSGIRASRGQRRRNYKNQFKDNFVEATLRHDWTKGRFSRGRNGQGRLEPNLVSGTTCVIRRMFEEANEEMIMEEEVEIPLKSSKGKGLDSDKGNSECIMWAGLDIDSDQDTYSGNKDTRQLHVNICIGYLFFRIDGLRFNEIYVHYLLIPETYFEVVKVRLTSTPDIYIRESLLLLPSDRKQRGFNDVRAGQRSGYRGYKVADWEQKYHSSDFDEAFPFLSEVPATAVDSFASFVGQDHQRREPSNFHFSLGFMLDHPSLLEAGMRPETLNIFPSQPLHTTNPASTFKTKRKGKNKEASSSSGKDDSSIPDSKNNDDLSKQTMRRLAQNREAARKSRLRKKAYVQQLESSRMKLTQLEQELQQAKNQVRLSLYKKMSFITLNRKSSCSSLIHGDLRQQ
ncbi:bZIP transcription factor TGA10 isoform X1 [Tanacetum coccineum]